MVRIGDRADYLHMMRTISLTIDKVCHTSVPTSTPQVGWAAV